MPESKKAWYSKTNLLGVVQMLIGIAGVIGGSELIQHYPRAVSAVAVASGILTIILRSLTSTPVEW